MSVWNKFSKQCSASFCREWMDTISHFAFDLPLWPVYVLPDDPIKEQCVFCYKVILGDAYAVKNDLKDYPESMIHEECAKLPEKLKHLCHPHLLDFKIQKTYTDVCNVCGDSTEFMYYCSHCVYALDIKCALLTPKKHQKRNADALLIPCQGQDYFEYFCYCCKRVIEGVVHFQPESSRLLHESCATLPEEIDHPFHTPHPLALVPQGAFPCNACGLDASGYNFHCAECGFYLDVHCAFLMPTGNYRELSKLHAQHPLIECDCSRSVEIHCIACRKPFKSSLVYVCIECHTLLHQSCMNVPLQLQHPFHWQHPLILYQQVPEECSACGEYIGVFGYVCKRCCFAIHFACAWPIPSVINSGFHQHPLALFDKATRKDCYCRICSKNCIAPFFCCLQCGCFLHLYCIPELPRVLKHKRHLHPLHFTDSQVKDSSDEDEEAELYCNACEERRMLIDPTYYCSECHFVAHVNCLIPQILSSLEISSAKESKDGHMADATYEDVEDEAANAYIIQTEDADTETMCSQLDLEIADLEKEITEHKKKLDALQVQHEQKVKHRRFLASIW